MTHAASSMITIKVPASTPVTDIINFAKHQGLKLIRDEDGLVMVEVEPKTTIELAMEKLVSTHGG